MCIKEGDFVKDNMENLAENKLIILYLMNNVNCPLTNLQILRLLYDFEGFNYYYFQHLLSELIEKRYILNYPQGEEWLYEITEEGRTVLSLTDNMLPGIVKHKLDMITKDLLQVVQNEVSITAEFVPENDNQYITKCKIAEAHKVLFELNIFCSSQEQAKKIADNWKRNANSIYPEIIKMLTEK
jgi:predicted transcriptional regulator